MPKFSHSSLAAVLHEVEAVKSSSCTRDQQEEGTELVRTLGVSNSVLILEAAPIASSLIIWAEGLEVAKIEWLEHFCVVSRTADGIGKGFMRLSLRRATAWEVCVLARILEELPGPSVAYLKKRLEFCNEAQLPSEKQTHGYQKERYETVTKHAKGDEDGQTQYSRKKKSTSNQIKSKFLIKVRADPWGPMLHYTRYIEVAFKCEVSRQAIVRVRDIYESRGWNEREKRERSREKVNKSGRAVGQMAERGNRLGTGVTDEREDGSCVDLGRDEAAEGEAEESPRDGFMYGYLDEPKGEGMITSKDRKSRRRLGKIRMRGKAIKMGKFMTQHGMPFFISCSLGSLFLDLEKTEAGGKLEVLGTFGISTLPPDGIDVLSLWVKETSNDLKRRLTVTAQTPLRHAWPPDLGPWSGARRTWNDSQGRHGFRETLKYRRSRWRTSGRRGSGCTSADVAGAEMVFEGGVGDVVVRRGLGRRYEPLEDCGREFEEWVEDELTEFERECDDGRKSSGILFDIFKESGEE
ncbi:hypothetical protein C8R43DRAFT_941812 [Mycena crocata]|nr:hypothetical protein C8R43DRAFT_941812 [Mycena crocata]